LGFEDQVVGGDQDYNDVILNLSWNCTVDTSLIQCYNTCRYAAQVFDSATCTCACPNPADQAACVGPTVGWNSSACSCMPIPSRTRPFLPFVLVLL
jgi:hypothetical protein